MSASKILDHGHNGGNGDGDDGPGGGMRCARFTEKWVSGMLPQLDLKGIDHVFIRSPKGTGKTTAVADWLQGESVVVIAHLVTLVHGLAEKFRAVRYDRSDAGTLRQQDARFASRFATTIHSLWRCHERAWGGSTVVVDELTQVMRLLSGCSPGRDGIDPTRRVNLLAVFLHAIRSSRQSIHLDADLTPQYAQLLARLAGIPLERCLFVYNDYRPERGEARRVGSLAELADLAVKVAAFPQALQPRQGVLLYTASTRRQAEVFAQRLRAAGVEHLLVTADTRRKNPEVGEWLKAPQSEGAYYRVVVVSPALSTGVSLDTLPDGSPLFKHVFHAGVIHGLHLDDHRQQIARVRGAPQVTYFITHRKLHPEKPAEDRLALAEAKWTDFVTTGRVLLTLPVEGAPTLDRGPYEPLLALYGFCRADLKMSWRGAPEKFEALARTPQCLFSPSNSAQWRPTTPSRAPRSPS